MSWLKSFFCKRSSQEAGLDPELHFHLQALLDEKLSAGLSPQEARRLAILEFGGDEQVKEVCRDVYRIASLEHAAANLKSAFRFLRKSPAFSLTVVFTFALGIGANSAVFSAIDAILLRPLPFPDSDRLAMLRQYTVRPKSNETNVAPARLEDWQKRNGAFEVVSGYYTEDDSELSGPLPERLNHALGAPRFLQVLGVAPALGRDFTKEEEHFGGLNAVLISDRLWRRRFHADPHVVGQALHIGKYLHPIVGVMPPSFIFPDKEVDIWSVSPPDASYAQRRENTWFLVFGRLKPGLALSQAAADLARVQAQLARQYPKTDGDISIDLQPLKESMVGASARSLWLLFGAVSLLLLLACTNIATLLLARAEERTREIAIRYSLGASRASIVWQLLAESMMLALLGSLCGLLLAAGASAFFRSLAKALPRVEEITLDWRLVLYAFACALACTVLFGLVPALHATCRSVAGSLAGNSRTQVSGSNPLQWLLVGTQVALAVTLLVGAALLLRSFEALRRVSPGFDAAHILTFRLSGNWAEMADVKSYIAGVDRELDAVRSLPGVAAAATSSALPGTAAECPPRVQAHRWSSCHRQNRER